MSNGDMVRAWKDPDARDLTWAPAHPAGEIALPEPEPFGAAGLAPALVAGTQDVWSFGCCTIGCYCCACGCGQENCACNCY